MTRRRSVLARATAACVLGAIATSVAVASADELPASTPEVYLGSTGSSNLASRGYDGQGVTVAVIDTGVADVPGFNGKVIHQQNISSAPDEGDQYGHGTFVAGIIHQAAPEAELISIKLSDANGAVDVTQVFAALQWVIVHKDVYGIDVVNLSFGNDSKQSAYTSPLNWAVQRLWDAGIVVVASAGNLGDGANTVTKPADDPLIISVGATDENGNTDLSDDSVAPFGSRGPTQDSLNKPDLVAPGTRLVSLRAPGSTVDVEHPEARVGEDHFRGSGTSFAAPLAVGVIAQMLSADPSLTPNQVKYGLLNSAAPVGGDATAQGHGTIRAVRALRDARQGVANHAVVRSIGTGSIEGARGSASVKVETPVITEEGTVEVVEVPVEGNVTAEVVPTTTAAPDIAAGEAPEDGLDTWDPLEFLDPEQWTTGGTWDASRWGSSQWEASRWGASRWGASRWGASRWGSSQWWASRWG